MEQEASLEERVRALLDSDAFDHLATLVTAMRPSEFATLAASLEAEEVARLLALFPDEWLPDYVAELEPEEAADYLQTLPADEAADIVAEMEPDDAADIVAELDEAEAEEILGELEPDDAAELRELIAYPPDTAGGRMTPAFVAIEPELRADQAITALRKVAEEAETINYVYVIDRSETLLGVLPLHRLVLSRSDARIRDLMTTSAIKVRADEDQERVARVLTDHNLLAVPVVDDADRLLGIVTQDDVADVLVEEATEDIERLGGSQPLETPYRLASIGLLVRRRLVWLLMLFIAEAYTGTVLRHYEEVTSSVVALTFFLPLLIGTGGNVGSQTVTTLVRAMGVGEIQLRDIRWVVLKEFAVAVIMGVVMALFAFGRAEMLKVGSHVSIVVALTILAICVWSATVAATLPLLLRKARIDPAVVSSPLIATLVDGTGLIIYFTIARLVLSL